MKQKPRGYWEDIENRRKFFNDYAAEMGFDPKDPTKWKQETRAALVAKKVRLLLSALGMLNFLFLVGSWPIARQVESLPPADPPEHLP